MTTYHRRHYGISKLYVAVAKDGKTLGATIAFNQTEAREAFRKRGFKTFKVSQS